MRIGYSFWGFLGPGITDTPDGGRSHRRTLIEGLRGLGHEIVFLQQDRDRIEAGTAFAHLYTWDDGLPDIDAVFLEWRWPIPGRNTTPCGTSGHTCDLHRQHQLLDHYTRRGLPTIVWDKDLHLPAGHPLRHAPHVTVCEAALHPTAGAVSLLFPVDDNALDTADPDTLTQRPRPLSLAYIGNQYDRDEAFDSYFAAAASGRRDCVVAGKWVDTRRWPQVRFIGRVPFSHVARIHGDALATVLLLPDRYAAVGQMTQRLSEAVLAGCLPLTPAYIRSAPQFTPWPLHVTSSAHLTAKVAQLRRIATTAAHADLVAQCLAKLDTFRLSRQLDTLDRALSRTGVRS
ncbi:hypothetical protein [Nocardia sp. CNY236]|uniref:hypothetical protein n=1 Tax=Nocardia sp. CNY236 TaxID=1169152 RepID=UPI000406FBED|nr:hypothetical protein [Nocardia sp. CNY236]